MTKRPKKPRKPLSEENKPGRHDPRNRLNDLTGKEWLLLTKSYWLTEPSPHDKKAYAHPAPFLVRDIQKLISLFTKKGMTVLDPFAGTGTTLLAANLLKRKAIGIDLSAAYRRLTDARMKAEGCDAYDYIVGDAAKKLVKIHGQVDYIVTSPPYHNILKNKGNGIRKMPKKSYRMAAREGVAYYSDARNDLGNFDRYEDFLAALKDIMTKCHAKLKNGRYCTLILSDFTVDKAEVCVQADVVTLMREAGFAFCGTTVLLQPVKPLFPFGYPYRYKINHHHQNIMTFEKAA
jgi:DNA modification methylase